MNKLLRLEYLVNNGGSQDEIDKLRAELGITKDEKKVKKSIKNNTKAVKSKEPKEHKVTSNKKELTVEVYRDLKAQGRNDMSIIEEFGMHNQSFYQWKKKHNLVVSKENEAKEDIQTDVKEEIPVLLYESTENEFVVLQEVLERPESEHYHTGKVDVWKFADENFNEDEVIGFHRINTLKYIARYGKKNGKNVSDLKKAIVSLEKLIELEEAK